MVRFLLSLFLMLFLMGSIALPSLSGLWAGAHFTEFNQSNKVVTRRWDKNPVIRWRYNPSGAPANARDIIESALNEWIENSPTTITQEYAGTTTNSSPQVDGYSDFFFNISFSSQGLPNDLIAITFRNGVLNDFVYDAEDEFLTEGDIMLNPSLSAYWISSTPTAPSDLDLYEILTHEIGHLLGLAHSFLIDSMMYPAKPSPSTAAALKALFRYPKRDLAQDDISWVSKLYEQSGARNSYSRIEGRAFYNGAEYVGAQVIAVKLGESDLDFHFYPEELTGTMIVKGMKNVSAFSEVDGRFKLEFLEPGDYQVITQDGDSFLTLSLAQVNDYLTLAGSSSFFPLDIWSNPDCSSSDTINLSNFSSRLSTATSLSLTAGHSVCGLDLFANTGQDRCAREPSIKGLSCGGGGCSLSSRAQSEYNLGMRSYLGTILFFAGTLIVMFSLKSMISRGPKSKKNRPS